MSHNSKYYIKSLKWNKEKSNYGKKRGATKKQYIKETVNTELVNIQETGNTAENVNIKETKYRRN